MNAFESFWSAQSFDDAVAKATAQAAWDSALCAVQEQLTDPSGALRPGHEIAATVSRLHSWNTTPAA